MNKLISRSIQVFNLLHPLSVLIEQDEKWSSMKYFDMDDYYQFINDQQITANQSAA